MSTKTPGPLSKVRRVVPAGLILALSLAARGGEIGDRVWLDLNANGIQDVGESGLSNLTVRLGVDQGMGPVVIGTTTTDVNGLYAFGGLTAGTYRVSVIRPSGYDFTTPNVGLNDAVDSDIAELSWTWPFALAAGQTNLSVDAGLITVPPPGIRLIKTAGDAPDGATLSITSGQQVVYTYVVTNIGVTYLSDVVVVDDQFDDPVGTVEPPDVIPPGGSRTFTASTNVAFSVTNLAEACGTSCTAQGAPLGVGACTNDIAVVRVLDPGAPGLIGDRVWRDLNANGIQDAGEPGFSNVTVRLGVGHVVIGTTTTDVNGLYAFGGLTAGTYQVSVIRPNGYDFTTPNVGLDDAVDSDIAELSWTLPFALLAGETNTFIDAGFVPFPPGGIRLVVTAGNAPDGGTFETAAGLPVTYQYVVSNTGVTYLTQVGVCDSEFGCFAVVDPPTVMAPGETRTFTVTSNVASSITNLAEACGIACNASGDAFGNPVCSLDDAAVRVKDPPDLAIVYEMCLDGDQIGVWVTGPTGTQAKLRRSTNMVDWVDHQTVLFTNSAMRIRIPYGPGRWQLFRLNAP